MAGYIKINKGLNINLLGEAEKLVVDLPLPETVAIKPTDFVDVVPKLLVKENQEVKAGTPLFLDKNNESVKYCSPVSGEVVEILRGEKRKILEIKILADKEINFIPFQTKNWAGLSRDSIKEILLESGVWPFIRQRPYGIVALPQHQPKSIFISAFDSAPLAPDTDFIMSGSEADFQTGIDVLARLTDGKIHLNIHQDKPSAFFEKTQQVVLNRFRGPHPSGNVGVQIHHIDPINKGETVWCLQPQDVLVIGRLFNHGRLDCTRIVAVTGGQVQHPKYFKTIIGTTLHHMLEEAGLKPGDNRVISGNVLTGSQVLQDDHLDFYDTQITVIPEGNQPEFMGWLAPGFDKYSHSRTFFSWLMPHKKHNLNTNLHGEERPFVMTGEYEKVFPMNIYPVQLLKSILIEDVELMEKLGIYEVVEEDFALCEFICTSKIESQEIIRRGLEMVRKEFS